MTSEALEIRTTVDIEAAPDRVWQLLMEFDDYQVWNPFIRGIKADKLSIGGTLYIRVRRPPGSESIRYTAKITDFKPGAEISWRRTMGFGGLFASEHAMIIVQRGHFGSCFIQRERFSGMLADSVYNRIGSDIAASFKAMNRALKAAAEK